MDAYSAAAHTCTPKLMLADDTIVTADTIVATVDPMKPSRTKFVANFTLPTDTPSARVRLEATTNSVINVPFGQDGLVRKRQRVGQGEAMANVVPLAGGALSGAPCKASHRAGGLLPA